VQTSYLAIAEAGLDVEGVVATIEAYTVSGCRHLNNFLKGFSVALNYTPSSFILVI
jgi:hypothetical protein